MDNSKFNVVLSNQIETGKDRTQVIENLARLFKTSPQKIQKLFEKAETVIKKDIPEAQAKKFQLAIHKTGGICHLLEVPSDFADLPDIAEPVATRETKVEIQPFNKIDVPKENKRISLGLVYEKPESSEKQDAAIASVDAENFCPECGTIRASADSVCLHCNYDPLAKEKINFKKFIIPSAAVILIGMLAYIFGLPLYKEYSKKVAINEGLLVAFDVKNKVTEFIEKTNFWPNQNIDASLPKDISNNIIESVIISDNAVITATLRASVLNKTNQTLIFTPRVLNGRVIWNCHKGSLEEKYRPELCIARIPAQ
ncbi:MAG: pilin [Gammaproteobacteria bacterium]|nr:pilin [Gammaproteobacteria bacterium]